MEVGAAVLAAGVGLRLPPLNIAAYLQRATAQLKLPNVCEPPAHFHVIGYSVRLKQP